MNHLLPILIMLSLETSATAQKREPIRVPEAAKSAFTAKFPKAEHVEWEMENAKDFEANFKEGGTERSATFDAGGKWIETETGIKANELPAAVTASMAHGYADRKVKETARVETPDRGTLYEVELEKGGDVIEVQFDAKGNVIGSKKEPGND